MLSQLLERLSLQRCNDFTFSVVVVDNDPEGSARKAVLEQRSKLGLDVTYEVEPKNNIAAARNRALRLATGSMVAFIDDDEIPVKEWLELLRETMRSTGAVAVLAPVEPRYDSEPPAWLVRSGLTHRKRFPTGTELTWKETRTGNVLLRRSALAGDATWFDPDFGVLGGEDVMFFRRFLSGGRRAVWCDEAVAYEWVTGSRITAKWILKRAFLQGYVSFHYAKHEMCFPLRVKILLKSAFAMLCYSGVLLVAAPFGFHVLMRFLVKWTHHVSRGLASLGLAVVTRRPA